MSSREAHQAAAEKNLALAMRASNGGAQRNLLLAAQTHALLALLATPADLGVDFHCPCGQRRRARRTPETCGCGRQYGLWGR